MVYEINNVYKEYKQGKVIVNALNGIELKLSEGKFYALMGVSGSGKSTLLHLLGALDNPTKGTIMLDGDDLSKLNENLKSKIRNEKIGFIFQKYYLIPTLNVFENVELPLLQCKEKKIERKDINDLIEQVGMSQYINQRVSNLSGGQQQRVAIARALIMKPRVVLADEPTANLDSENSKNIIQLMKK